MEKPSFFRKMILCFRPRDIFRSEDGRTVIRDAVENGRVVRLLLVNGIRESGIYLDERIDRDPLFYYMQTLKEISCYYEGLDDALLIGGGGLAFPRYYFDARPNGRMTVIEKDTKMADLAQKYFFVKEDDRLSLKISDGASYITKTATENALVHDSAEKGAYSSHVQDSAGKGTSSSHVQGSAEKKAYSFIIFDAFDGNRPPKELFSEGMYKLTKQIMKRDGILAMNMLNERPGVISMQTYLVQSTLKSIFRNTKIINCREGWNCILLSSDRNDL